MPRIGISIKLLLIGELVLLVAVLTMLLPIRREMHRQVVAGLQHELQSIASTASLQIVGEWMKSIRENDPNSIAALELIRDTLARVHDATGIGETHIYTRYRDTANPEKVKLGMILHSAPFVGEACELRDELIGAMDHGQPQATGLYLGADGGEFLSAYAPIRDRAGEITGILEVEKPVTKDLAAYRRITAISLAIAGAVLGISTLLGWLVLNRVIIRPMRAVRCAVNALANQDFRHRVRLRTRDEFQDLGDALNRMSEQLNVAQRVQKSFFPARLPQQGGYRIAAHTEACEATAGDYVDAFEIDADRIAIVVADVTGHGIGPSLLMAACRAALRALAASQVSPGEIVRRLDALLANDLTDGRFITMIFGVLESDGTFTFTNAGHGPALLVQNGRPIVLDAHRPPLGVGLDDELDQTTIQLHVGDRVFLCSDGVSEAMDDAGEQFGAERIARVIANDSLDAHEVIERISRDIRTHSGRSIMNDDVTILCVDRVSDPSVASNTTQAAFETVPG